MLYLTHYNMKEFFDNISCKFIFVYKIVQAILNKIVNGDSQTRVLTTIGIISNIFLFSSLLSFIIVLIVDFLIYLSIKDEI